MFKRIVIGIIVGYQYFISPLIGCHCRFFPSCSQYSKLAIEQHGVIFGTWLMIKRLLVCHPLHSGGYDPVPKKKIYFNNSVKSRQKDNVR